MNTRSIRSLIVRLAPAGAVCGYADAASLTATIEIPRLNVAEYHRPYVAAWIETPHREFAASLAVWYDTEMADEEGETWLKDLRQWWRKSGRQLDLPIDGLSGPTRPAGVHELSFDRRAAPLAELAEGDYVLVVEAAREVGGRELLRLPFQWSAHSAVSTNVQGERELGAIQLKIEPK